MRENASAANGPIVQAIAVLALAAIVYYASLRAQLTVGGFVSFITAMALLLAPLKRLSNLNEVLQKSVDALTHVPMRRRPALLLDLQLHAPPGSRPRLQPHAPTRRQRAELADIRKLLDTPQWRSAP